MKKITLFLIMLPMLVKAQPSIHELGKQLGDTYIDFDLTRTIRTNRDFQQTTLSVQSIDSQIERIITSQNLLPLTQVIVPFNQKRLIYLGKIHPVKTNLFYEDIQYFINNDAAIKGDQTHVYKYDNIYITSKSNTLLDRYLVYYTIRAYLIIKFRYPDLYKRLFESTKSLPLNYLSQRPNPAFINLTQSLMVTFDGILPLASNNAYFGSMQVAFNGPAKAIEIYPNTQLMYFNRNTVINGGAAGGVAIYKNIVDSGIKFHTYMLDGFIHSFIHERIHDWVFQYKNFNDQAEYLRTKCVSDGTVDSYYPFEEAVVNNTTNVLFEMHPNNGGLSDDVLKFYRTEFAMSIDSFKAQGSYQRLTAELKKYNSLICPTPCLFKRSTSYSTGDDTKMFFINLFTNEP